MSSQVPFLEERVGWPHVLTVDIHDAADVDAALASVRDVDVQPLIPHQFSMQGFLQRINSYVENQVW